MLFSQRQKITPVKSIAQREAMDDALRFGLWDAFHVCIWENINNDYFKDSNLYMLFLRYWHSYFHRPLDNLPDRFYKAHEIVREYFMKCTWHEVYDFTEFTAKNMPDSLVKPFTEFCNRVLVRELSAFRFVDLEIAEITSEEEIASIEDALENTNRLKGVHHHLRTSLSLMSDRSKPDFRNSIKESISAVEALAQLLTSDPKATLGAALRVLESRSIIHPALKASLSSLYGYTSEADGIRHAMLEEPTLSYCDAKFMLVSCTAFTNYLITKATENGLKVG